MIRNACLLALLLTLAAPRAHAASRICSVLWDHVLGFSAKEVCTKNGGTGCAESKNDAEALCRAAGRLDECKTLTNDGQAFCLLFGSVCLPQAGEAEAYCQAANFPTCDKNAGKDRRPALRRLLERCGPLE